MKFDVGQAKVKGPRQLNIIMDALTRVRKIVLNLFFINYKFKLSQTYLIINFKSHKIN
jgi:hypothetical protein